MVRTTQGQAKRFGYFVTLVAPSGPCQVLDIAGSSSPDSVFASKTRKRPGRQQRHPVDVFRTKLWFQHLRIVSGATSTYQMDVRVEAPLNLPGPAADRKNKWRSYRDGRHTPSAPLVSAINARFPNSSSLLNHGVWKALRLDRPVRAGLDGVPHGLLARIHTTTNQQSLRLDGWNWRMHRALEREASLDALACWVVLLRVAADAGYSRSAFGFGLSLCRTLLLLAPVLERGEIAAALGAYIEQSILPLAAHGGFQHSFGKIGFVSASRHLWRQAWMVDAESNTPRDWQERTGIALDLLYDLYTVDMSTLIVTAS